MKHHLYFPMNNKIKENIVLVSHKLAQEKLVTAWDGNVSGAIQEGFWITPRHQAKENIREKDLVFVSWKKRVEFCTRIQPSSEWRFHQGIYEVCPEVDYVLHAHPFYLTLISDEEDLWHQKVLGEEMLDLAQLMRIEHFSSGSERLAMEIKKRAPNTKKALMIKKHGIVAWGKDPLEIFYTICAFERYAKAITIKNILRK